MEIFYEDGKVMRNKFLELAVLLEKDRKGKWTPGKSHQGHFLPDDENLEAESRDQLNCRVQPTTPLMTRRQTEWHPTSVRPTSSQKTQIHTAMTATVQMRPQAGKETQVQQSNISICQDSRKESEKGTVHQILILVVQIPYRDVV